MGDHSTRKITLSDWKTLEIVMADWPFVAQIDWVKEGAAADPSFIRVRRCAAPGEVVVDGVPRPCAAGEVVVYGGHLDGRRSGEVLAPELGHLEVSVPALDAALGRVCDAGGVTMDRQQWIRRKLRATKPRRTT